MTRTAAALLLGWLAVLAQAAQPYPNRPIRMVVTVPPGGAADFTARLIGQHLSEALQETVVIDNRGGASGTIAADLVAKSSPDGHTLLANSITTHGIGLHLFSKLPYDPVKDFEPIVQLNIISLILVMNRDLPVASVKELISLAKSKPGSIRFASAGNGSAPHMTAELFKAVTGVELVHVPYKGSGPAVVDLASNQVQLMFDGAPSLIAHIKSGRLRPLAAASAKRNILLTELPTFEELGIRGIQAGLWYGLLAPAKTPRSIIESLNGEVNRILALPEVRKRFAAAGAEVVGGSAEAYAQFMRAEQARWGALVRKVGVKLD